MHPVCAERFVPVQRRQCRKEIRYKVSTERKEEKKVWEHFRLLFFTRCVSSSSIAFPALLFFASFSGLNTILSPRSKDSQLLGLPYNHLRKVHNSWCNKCIHTKKNLYTKPNQAMEEEKSWNEFPLLLFNENEKKFLNELTAHRKQQRKNKNFVVVPQASGSVNIQTTRIVLTQKHRRKKCYDLIWINCVEENGVNVVYVDIWR